MQIVFDFEGNLAMERPDPHQIPRRPMATAEPRYSLTGPGRPKNTPAPLFDDKRLNIDTVHQLVESAEAMSEGRAELEIQGERFYGSCVLCLAVETIAADRQEAHRLADSLMESIASDNRAIRVIEDRTYRELSRLLGVDTSVDFECQVRTVRDGSLVRVIVDFECPIDCEEQIAR